MNATTDDERNEAGSLPESLAPSLQEFLSLVRTAPGPNASSLPESLGGEGTALADCLDGLEFLVASEPAVESGGCDPEGDGGSLEPSTRVGDYRIIREVGRGGMGVVYEAEQLSLGRKVALKVLPYAASIDPRRRQRFQLEAQAAAHLHHPHIVPVFAVGRDRGVHYYAMQFIEGRSLAGVVRDLRRQAAGTEDSQGSAETSVSQRVDAFLEEEGPSPLACGSSRSPAFFRTIARLGLQAAEAIEHAHALGVIHRDVKPANLLVDGQGALWVTDFGLARFLDDPGMTRSGDLLGTLAYMSPEQAQGRREADHRADLYSLGATLYELLTLRRAFDGRDRQELLRKIANDEPIRPRKLNPSLPKDLETVVLKAMEKEPTARYASAKDLADDLRRFLDDQPVRARRPNVLERGAKWSRRHRPVVLTGSTVLLLAMSVGTALMYREHRQTDEARRTLRENFRTTFALADAMTFRAMSYLTIERDADGPPAEAKRSGEFYRMACDFYESVTRQPAHDPEMRAMVAHATHRVGFIRGITRKPGAEEAFRLCLRQFEALIAESPDNPRYKIGLADALNDWSDLAAVERGHDDAEVVALHRRAITIRQEVALAFPPMPDEVAAIASSVSDRLERLEAAGRKTELRAASEALSTFYQTLATRLDADPALRRKIASSHRDLAARRRVSNQRPSAERLLRLARILDPSDAETANDLARLLTAQPGPALREHSEAVELAREAVRNGPEEGRFRSTLGVALFRKGDWQRALDSLTIALKLRTGGDAHDWFYLAMVHARLNQPADAWYWYALACGSLRKQARKDADLAGLQAEANSAFGLPPNSHDLTALETPAPLDSREKLVESWGSQIRRFRF